MFGGKKDTSRFDFIYNDPKEIAPDVPFPETPGELEQYQVHFFGKDDPENPQNMSAFQKGVLLLSTAYVVMVATWGSAIAAPATPVFQKLFHLGLPVATLSVSLYVVGFAVGPIIFGPMSGVYGRKVPLFIGSFGLMLFMFAAATAKDWQTIVLSRFFQGVFGAASITVGPSMPGDAFSSEFRGSSLTIVSFCVIAGPMVAPIVGGFIVQSFLGWRWTMYITGIMAALACVLVVFVIPETYPKTILQRRANKLRADTGNWAIRAPGELESVEFKTLAKQVLLGPVIMLVRETILGLITLYHGFIYGILYLCLEAVPFIFTGYHFKGAILYLPYIALLTGAILVCTVNLFVHEPMYAKALVKYNKPVLPEQRLYLMCISGVVFTVGVFLMCWSGAYPTHVHWIVPCIGAGFIGYGIIGIFLAAFNYILDTYLHMSAMAFAANTFFRSAFGCAFPLFVHPLFKNLGIQWAGTLIGCLAALMIPVPILFLIFGAKLRSISPYAVNLDDHSKDKETKEFGKEPEFGDESDSNMNEEYKPEAQLQAAGEHAVGEQPEQPHLSSSEGTASADNEFKNAHESFD